MATKRKNSMTASGPNKRQKNSLVTTTGGGASTALSTKMVVPRAITTKMNNGSVVRISNTEVWNDLFPIVSGTFGAVGSYINPILKLVWAGSIALNFSKYRFTKLKFHYRPIVATTQGGWFAMAFASDPEDATSADTLTVGNTLPRLANCRRFVQVPVWQEATLEVQRSDYSQDWYLIEASSIADQATARQCVAGAFFQAAQSTSTAATGILYVEYDLELMDPVNSQLNR